MKAIAKELGVKTDEVVEMETRLSGQDIALEPGSDDDEDTVYAPIAYLAADDAEPGALVEQEQTARLRTAGLEQALEQLDPRSRRIIEARWLKDGESATLHDLAAEFGVSAERIRQIEQRAMQKIRSAMSG